MSGIPQDDPFAGGVKRPAISFKNAPVGTSYTGKVVEPAKLVQARDYDTDKPAFWDDGNPKMTAVIVLDIDGEEKGLWAPKPSSIFSAFADAQRQLGRPVAVGDTVKVTFSGEEISSDPVKAKKNNPKKLYTIELFGADAFASTPDL